MSILPTSNTPPVSEWELIEPPNEIEDPDRTLSKRALAAVCLECIEETKQLSPYLSDLDKGQALDKAIERKNFPLFCAILKGSGCRILDKDHLEFLSFYKEGTITADTEERGLKIWKALIWEDRATVKSLLKEGPICKKSRTFVATRLVQQADLELLEDFLQYNIPSEELAATILNATPQAVFPQVKRLVQELEFTKNIQENCKEKSNQGNSVWKVEALLSYLSFQNNAG